jgi:hypothetical protein
MIYDIEELLRGMQRVCPVKCITSIYVEDGEQDCCMMCWKFKHEGEQKILQQSLGWRSLTDGSVLDLLEYVRRKFTYIFHPTE